jgi:type IV pilus assembly protein PilV
VNNRFRTRAGHKGFSIVEVLVALVVLGAGMLGVASLYMTTLRASGSAISRMQAVNLASDLAERIRANRNAGIAYEDDVEASDADTSCTTASCEPDALATRDLGLWRAEIEATLPGIPTGVVDFTEAAAGEPDTYVITVSWSDQGQEDPISYALRMQL